MREGWKEVKLGEILEIKHGYGFKGEYFTDEKTEDILVTPGNFHIGGGFKGDKLKFYKGPVNENFVLKENDVVVTMTDLSKMADTIGFSAKIPAKSDQRYLHNQRIGLVSLLDESFDLNFIYWLLRTNSYQRYIAGSAIGATVKHTSPSKIYTAKVIVPENKETQRKIASILSGYDDLIENNLKRIKILEEMAQQTYEEWFVRMRFPGFETAKIDEVTGLPEGWEKVKLGDLCEKIFDGTHDSPKPKDAGYKLITGKHLQKGKVDFESAYYISEEDHLKIKKRSGLEKGDIMFSNIGTIGNLSMVTEDFEYSCKNMIVFRPQKDFQYFLYTYLFNENNKNKMISEAAGSTQKFLSLGYIRGFEDVLPSIEMIKHFNEFSKNLYITINNLQNQNQRLREARDILLPRLMMGMVEV